MTIAKLATTTIPGACPHDCPDRCAWLVTVEGERAVKVAGDPRHPFTRGTLCAKVNHYIERVYGPDRVLYPLKRTGAKGTGAFARVSDRVRPGVVAMPSGWWASLSPGGTSANALTPDGLSLWGGGGDFHDTLVEVARVSAAMPATART